ncbi:purH [Wigglesworthia glossinidia endosymbiont of Glossina brevipalpis]|uniref:Bifunctional purine biosynthesis protein PurH n=1 Tax=Wigglesworthia glossinidia brevipalpis TaxID=36870 RepID=PUR9_WIGBR|nr:RecName: Full=Bifunctional purine biosynthesis protein PurH; Includes: RecName: Full=Phosphoribosylaminoimidazolecarboxamide formyltransferase; AltName: Full=AICAR transformylase; Includes: RecName: Full=IMP cyclohydrolase; AltName: Full=ATIC; AltName: Full=IMP synthase; AltName: Full=Inosinicase [Wigglesworthia glossinidia endosymbiont of Glossina brevipalpis]BAC24657.1 purH [Wigglesworthia glossinidia endosymbiont of Glossina brevipalpis]
MEQSFLPIRCALISVSDKTGIFSLAKNLIKHKVKLITTSGTYKYLLEKGIFSTSVSEYINHPEIINGRVKTLHPKIHGGILSNNKNINENKNLNIKKIDMVITNFYPFKKKVKKENIKIENIIDNIDIGGVALARSAAKNYKYVTVVVNINQYSKLSSEMDKNSGSVSFKTRFYFSTLAFQYSYSYDKEIFNYFNKIYFKEIELKKNLKNKKFPELFSISFSKKEDVLYGENYHQKAAFYTDPVIHPGTVPFSIQRQGKKLSYNNIVDSDIAINCVMNFSEIACVIVKHSTPCGVSSGKNIIDAYRSAYYSDPDSAFGGIISFNRPLTIEAAEFIINKQFVEIIIAPVIEKDALLTLKSKSKIIVLECGYLSKNFLLNFKKVNCGLLLQDSDNKILKEKDIKIVSKRQPSKLEIESSIFIWKIIKFIKSNAIIYGKNKRTLGIGSGQTSRIFSTRIAAYKAIDQGFSLKGSVMASDAFFPFRDSIDFASKFGVSCIIQPGGSINDDKIISAVDENNMSMIFTNTRQFSH